MTPKVKWIIIGCSALLLTGATIFAIKKVKKNKEEKEKENLDALTSQAVLDDVKQSTTPKTTPAASSNPVGKKAYVSNKAGYINIRETAEVDNGYIDNLIGKIEGGGTPIGTITSVTKSTQDPPEDWYAIKLDKTMREWGISWNNIFVHASDVDVK